MTFVLLVLFLPYVGARAPFLRDRPRGLGLLQLPTGMTDERSGPFFPNLYVAGDKGGQKPMTVPDIHLPGQEVLFSGRTAFNPFTHAVGATFVDDLTDSWGAGFAVNGVNNFNLPVRRNFDQFAEAPLDRSDGQYQPFLTGFAVGSEYDFSKIREVSGHLDLPIPGVNELFDVDGRIMMKSYGNGILNSALEFPLTLTDPNERAPYTFKYLNYMADRHMQYGHVVPNVNLFLVGKDKIMGRLTQNRLNPTMLEWKSYLRLRQTCKALEELIRTSGQIKEIPMDRRLFWEQPTEWVDLSDGQMLVVCQKSPWYLDDLTPIDPDCLYGLRPAVLLPRLQYDEDPEILANSLKEYRISADCLSILNQNSRRIPVELSKEECQQLLAIVRPEKIILSSENSDSFKALFQADRIKSVDVHVNPEDVCSAVERLLPLYEKVDISIPNTNQMSRYRTDEFLEMFLIILQFLRSTRLPTLRHFRLNIANGKGDQLPSIEQLKDQFRIFDYTILPTDRPSSLYLSIPTHHGTCEFVLEFYAATIYYKSTE